MNDTVYIKLFAGLGNQLFQYSYGQYLSDTGQKIKYIMEPTKNCLTGTFDVLAGDIFSTSNSIMMIAMKAYAKYVVRNWFVDFFAEYKYAVHGKARLRFKRAETYKNNRFLEKITECNSVAIHVRGCDYLTESGFPGWGSICNKEYYKNAIARVESAIENPLYFVFSDDYGHARHVLPDSPNDRFIFVEGEEFQDDAGYHLFLMGSCKHNIIANSTYSWWGAFLGDPEGRLVITPDRWQRFTIPPEWIRV